MNIDRSLAMKVKNTMMASAPTGRKRALVLVGAGASVEFGVPATVPFTHELEAMILADEYLQQTGGAKAYLEIRDALAGYFTNGASDVNFEQIFHCAHELLFMFEPSGGVVNASRPLLTPFVTRQFAADERALRSLLHEMTGKIYAKVSQACAVPDRPLIPLARFIARLRSQYITRIYTTNYDDFLHQAAPDLGTGFTPATPDAPGTFSPSEFWRTTDEDGLCHLHGSVHLGFSHAIRSPRWAELYWFADRADAKTNASYMGSGFRRMDNTTVDPSSIVTGLDKLSRLQQAPFSYYYSALAQDALKADIILVIGCGLGDLHLNTWLQEARLRDPKTPIILVDWFEDGFVKWALNSVSDPKQQEIWHTLRLPVGFEPLRDDYSIGGFTMDRARTGAIWGSGFQNFLNAPGSFEAVLAALAHPRTQLVRPNAYELPQ